MRAAFFASHRIDLQGIFRQRKFFVDLDRHCDDLGIHFRLGRADRFGAELMELAQPSRLRPLLAEHRSDVIHFDQRLRFTQVILDVCSNDRSGSFRPQSQAVVAPVGERVHFFPHDVRQFADTPCEEGGLFEEGRTDFLIVEAMKDRADCRLNILPSRRFGGKDIFRASDRFESHGDTRCWDKPLRTRREKNRFDAERLK